jgi:dTDP-4-amino-4,6-dideoxygalactose transaminase
MTRHRRHLRVNYYSNLADEPCFADFARDCPNARKVADRTLFLPTYPRYGKAEVKKNIDALRSYFGR